ncbi:MAG: ATP synthase F1 subunit delta [Blastocatellia bacterium]
MSVTTIVRRYAEALADAAIAHNQVEQIDSDVRGFVEVMRANRELFDLFASPVVSQHDKSKVLDAIVARIHPGQMTANLLRTMLDHYRLHYLSEMYEQFRRIINERAGVVVAEVTTAQPLAQAEQALLSRKLEAMTGKQVQFQFKTDPELIGGVVTRIGSVVYDGSVRTQLQEIKQQLKQGDR